MFSYEYHFVNERNKFTFARTVVHRTPINTYLLYKTYVTNGSACDTDQFVTKSFVWNTEVQKQKEKKIYEGRKKKRKKLISSRMLFLLDANENIV